MEKRNVYRLTPNTDAINELTLRAIVIFCTVILIVGACGKVEIDPDLQKIVTYKFGESRENLTSVTDRVRASYDNPQERLLLEKKFAEILKSDATLECKDFICRQLWIIGSDVSVPALAKMLVDEETSDMARYALQLNPSSKAGKALRKSLGKTQGTVLIGIINSLGERRDEKSKKALEKLVLASDKEVASAASAAIDKISGGKSE